MAPNYYLNPDDSSFISIEGSGTISNNVISGNVKYNSTKIHPELYFKYVKKKFGILEKVRLDRRLKKIEKSFYVAVENGQDVLGNKLMNALAKEIKESVLYAKGIRYFVERDDLIKYKHNIKGGHISDTLLKDFVRIIPKDVLEKKKKVEEFFDGFVIWHYWDDEVEKKREKKEKISPEEKTKMKDPILFGIIKETNRLYFVADWEDEFCDLTFDEIIDEMGKSEEDNKLTKYPKLNL